ncbi:unnamed protein product [Linum tenue]|uniref:QWRF motif-containing protein 7 n=1 Tax=Linum tenue TaxID=586396 RepID=A0AAV0J3Y1_9ROSI|nr:unnamed protein product [Linum tenue]
MEHRASSRCRQRHHPPPPTQTPHHSPSPAGRLVRSKSGAEINNAESQQRLNAADRSRSTTRSRDPKFETSLNTSTSSLPSTCRRKHGRGGDVSPAGGGSRDGLVRFVQRGDGPRNYITSSTRPNTKLGRISPSAWALSPGRPNNFRAPQPPPPPESPGVKKRRASGGVGMVSGVLNYFRQKKGSSAKDEDRHGFRVLNSRLVQWRYANARAEAVMAARSRAASGKIFHVWLKVAEKRKGVLEKRLEIQRLKHGLKLGRVLGPQLGLLSEWGKMEGKNVEAVSRVARKLSALSLKLPLHDDVKGDVESVGEALSKAMGVMDGIQELLSKFFSQLERNLYLLTELTSSVENQNERLQEMDKIVSMLAHLLEWEKNVRVQVLRMVDKSWWDGTKSCALMMVDSKGQGPSPSPSPRI